MGENDVNGVMENANVARNVEAFQTINQFDGRKTLYASFGAVGLVGVFGICACIYFLVKKKRHSNDSVTINEPMEDECTVNSDEEI